MKRKVVTMESPTQKVGKRGCKAMESALGVIGQDITYAMHVMPPEKWLIKNSRNTNFSFMKAKSLGISFLLMIVNSLHAQVNGKIVSPTFSSVSQFVNSSFESSTSSIVLTNRSSFKLEIVNIFPNGINAITTELNNNFQPGQSIKIPATNSSNNGVRCFRSIAYKAADWDNENKTKGCELMNLQAKMGKEVCQAVNGSNSCFSYASSVLEQNNWCDNSSVQIYETIQQNNSQQPELINNTINDMNKSIEDAFNIIQENLANNRTTIPQEKVIEEKENKIVILQTIQLNELSTAPPNIDPLNGYFNIRTISGIGYFINKHSDVDSEKTTCNPEGKLHLVWAKQAEENQIDSFYVDVWIDLKKIDISSFEIRDSQKWIYLYFIGQDEVYELYMNTFKSRRKNNVENGNWNSSSLGSLSEGVIKLDKNLLDEDKQYLLKDFVERMKFFITKI